MAKRGRPATGQMPPVTIRLPGGWLRQLERIGDGDARRAIREIVGASLAARTVKGGDGVVEIDAARKRLLAPRQDHQRRGACNRPQRQTAVTPHGPPNLAMQPAFIREAIERELERRETKKRPKRS